LEVWNVQVNNIPGFEIEEHLNPAELEENKLAMIWFKKTLEVAADQTTENIYGAMGERSGSSRNDASNSLFCIPNPFTDGVQVYFDNPVDETGLVVISDMSGRVVFKDDIFIQKGVNSLILPNDRFGIVPNGTFRLTLMTEKNVRHASLVKL
jgi:hypothetical protein